ncbi:hypothetical protein Pla8534_59150 [Lignipirellula cremea]|uniref:Uncharacterized protein n=2 Tax=Lignipirellula cremea TaxID=2528010 RepID=A0A518E1V0_9BACT|nr:hypothetical protein Pla8534_59150 [Lignipirellula cremea]
MTETWLRPNRRLLIGVGLFNLLFFSLLAVLSWYFLWPTLSFLLVAFGLWRALQSWLACRSPRLAYGDGHLIVNLGPAAPIRIPIEVVEVFFLGQGPSKLPSSGPDAEASTIVVRLAEAAEDWKHRDVDPRFGAWCDGYITIRGAWCEPIRREVMGQLNTRLVEVRRERKQAG